MRVLQLTKAHWHHHTKDNLCRLRQMPIRLARQGRRTKWRVRRRKIISDVLLVLMPEQCVSFAHQVGLSVGKGPFGKYFGCRCAFLRSSTCAWHRRIGTKRVSTDRTVYFVMFFFWMKHEAADGEVLVSSPICLCDYMRTVETRTGPQGGNERYPVHGVLSLRPHRRRHKGPVEGHSA